MKKLAAYVDEHIGKRILLACALSFLFAYFPRVLFDTWFQYFDKTAYLQIIQPVSIDKKTYKPCDNTVLTATFTSLIDVNVRSLTQLVLVRDNGASIRVGTPIVGQTPIRAMKQHVISGAIPLPCDLDEGRYFWQGNGEYEVHGHKRTISFISDTFNVFNSGLSPNTEKNIDDAVQEESTKSGNVVQ